MTWGSNMIFLKFHCDRMSAICLAKNQVYHARTKLIDVRSHFVRDILDEGDIELKKIRTKNNLADMLTKVLQGLSSITARTYFISLKYIETFGGHLDNLLVT